MAELDKFESDFTNTKKQLLAALLQNRPHRVELVRNALKSVPTIPLEESLNGTLIHINSDELHESFSNTIEYKKITRTLKSLGITKFNIQEGEYTDLHNRTCKISKLFTSSSEARQDLETATNLKNGVSVLLTNNPWMKFSISTNRQWTSCTNVKNGYFSDKLVDSTPYLVAYILPRGADPDTPKAPIGRFLLGFASKISDLSIKLVHPEHGCSRELREIFQNEFSDKVGNIISDNNLNHRHAACPFCGQYLVSSYFVTEPTHLIAGKLYSSMPSVNKSFTAIKSILDNTLKLNPDPNISLLTSLNRYDRFATLGRPPMMEHDLSYCTASHVLPGTVQKNDLSHLLD